MSEFQQILFVPKFLEDALKHSRFNLKHCLTLQGLARILSIDDVAFYCRLIVDIQARQQDDLNRSLDYVNVYYPPSDPYQAEMDGNPFSSQAEYEEYVSRVGQRQDDLAIAEEDDRKDGLNPPNFYNIMCGDVDRLTASTSLAFKDVKIVIKDLDHKTFACSFEKRDEGGSNLTVIENLSTFLKHLRKYHDIQVVAKTGFFARYAHVTRTLAPRI